LLQRAECDEEFYRSLAGWCDQLRPLIDPERERKSWEELLIELGAEGRLFSTQP
jgi:hypothetical protein